MWTPSALLAFDDSMQEFGLTPENVEGPVQVFNSCMDSLADAVGKPPRIDPLQSQVACWENCSNADRSAAIHKGEEACQTHSKLNWVFPKCEFPSKRSIYFKVKRKFPYNLRILDRRRTIYRVIPG